MWEVQQGAPRANDFDLRGGSFFVVEVGKVLAGRGWPSAPDYIGRSVVYTTAPYLRISTVGSERASVLHLPAWCAALFDAGGPLHRARLTVTPQDREAIAGGKPSTKRQKGLIDWLAVVSKAADDDEFRAGIAAVCLLGATPTAIRDYLEVHAPEVFGVRATVADFTGADGADLSFLAQR